MGRPIKEGGAQLGQSNMNLYSQKSTQKKKNSSIYGKQNPDPWTLVEVMSKAGKKCSQFKKWADSSVAAFLWM